MGTDTIRFSGSAELTSHMLDLQDIATVVATIVKADHSFTLEPRKRGNDGRWLVTITIGMKDANSLSLLQELRSSAPFIE